MAEQKMVIDVTDRLYKVLCKLAGIKPADDREDDPPAPRRNSRRDDDDDQDDDRRNRRGSHRDDREDDPPAPRRNSRRDDDDDQDDRQERKPAPKGDKATRDNLRRLIREKSKDPEMSKKIETLLDDYKVNGVQDIKESELEDFLADVKKIRAPRGSRDDKD